MNNFLHHRSMRKRTAVTSVRETRREAKQKRLRSEALAGNTIHVGKSGTPLPVVLDDWILSLCCLRDLGRVAGCSRGCRLLISSFFRRTRTLRVLANDPVAALWFAVQHARNLHEVHLLDARKWRYPRQRKVADVLAHVVGANRATFERC